MWRKNQKIKKIRLIVIATIGLVFAVTWIALSIFRTPPSDEELVSLFFQHEKEMNVLIEMLASEPDGIIGVTRGKVMFKEPWRQIAPEEAGMPLRRFEDYQKVMAENRFQQIWRYDGETLVSLDAKRLQGGLANRGTKYAFVYRENVPPGLVESLDASYVRNIEAEHAILYRPLKNGWYIRLVL